MNVWFPAYTTNLSEKWIYMATWQLNFQKNRQSATKIILIYGNHFKIKGRQKATFWQNGTCRLHQKILCIYAETVLIICINIVTFIYGHRTLHFLVTTRI